MTAEVHYFSNGTEGEAWMANWCDRCANDHEMHVEPFEGGCEITRDMYCGISRPELLNNDREGMPWAWWTCMEFTPCQPCGEGGGDNDAPKPVPVHPDQGELFDATRLAAGVPRGVLLDEGLIREMVSR